MKSDVSAGQVLRHLADGPVPLVVLVTRVTHTDDGLLWVYILDHNGKAATVFGFNFTSFWCPLCEGQ